VDAIEYFTRHLDVYLGQLRDLVELETPTGDVARADLAADFLSTLLSACGPVERIPLDGFGPLLRVCRPGRGAHVLLSAHYDTVWPVGSWDTMWRVAGDVVRGPGVCDMKSGLLFIPWMLRWMDQTGRPGPHLEVVINPDEEVGSVASRRWLEAAAHRADFALVLEPANRDGGLKVARKGSGEYVVTIHGRSAHQGAEPEAGRNAVVEAAHQVLRLAGLSDHAHGATVGPNVIRGGSMSNVVPDRCEMRVDVRAWTAEEQHRLTAAITALEPATDGIRLVVTGAWNRPPMEPTEASMALYARARDIARTLGVDPPAERWGGSSDANLIAAAGAPCVDGFGAVGAGAHRPDELIVVSELPRRMAVFAETVASLTEPPHASTGRVSGNVGP
jgi:glutamate carboxypeptidase